jgi:hypothetical protein
MSKLNKRTFLKYAAGGLVSAAPIYASLAASGTDKMPESKERIASGDKVQYLFVQTATSVTVDDDKLTLHGINPVTLFFSDRPERITGHGSTDEWVKSWSKGKDSFASNPPNAVLSILDGTNVDGVNDIVVVLKEPMLSGNELSYTVKVLDGELPESGGISSLFIDIIGRPLTPLSYAGVARRTRRRVYRRNRF